MSTHHLEVSSQLRAGLVVDHPRDALDTTTTCQTADVAFGDTLYVVAKDLAASSQSSSPGAVASRIYQPMALRRLSSLSKTFATGAHANADSLLAAHTRCRLSMYVG